MAPFALTGQEAPAYDHSYRRPSRAAGHHAQDGPPLMSVQAGKKYFCPRCGAEFVITKGGEGELTCGDTPLELKK